MNLILLFPDDFCGGGEERVRLSGRRAEHVLAVHRAQVGDELTVGRVNGDVGRGRITSLASDTLEMEVRLHGPPPPPLPATLVLALPRPLVLKRVLIAATSMGVKRIVLVNAREVEKSFWQSGALSDASITEQLTLGLEQARDTSMPVVSFEPRFKPFVEDVLPGLVGGARALVAHPAAAASCPGSVPGEVLLAVGPESGWNDYELERLVDAGLRPISLGPRSLRVETAVPALLARLL